MKIRKHRIFYVRTGPTELVLLHAYRKESQKAPAKDIQTADRRLQLVLEGESNG